ncbi:MAG: hypothetical protein A2V93_05735 [Ignavibacteria bacterium RBG_16_34_14]|nr:MAG: hypothetical protein A2V93_05735 [Ignavibacteria bacterium RBG_16_34_14]
MDDIFQILIYIFIIVSFLASLFKKKQKPQDKSSEPAFKPTPQPRMETKPSQQEDYDILKEIEKMFKTEIPAPQKEREMTLQKENIETPSEHTRSEDWHQPSQQEHKATFSEHTPEMWEDKRRKTEEKRKVVNEKIIKQATMFEKHLTRTDGEKSDIRKNMKQRFKEPASLKEYIIFSEIIGKPKALQE